jgi:hypothetical protein
VLLVFPLIHSYWLVGGFFAFTTASSLVVFGLAVGLRWLAEPTTARGLALAALATATFLWHALAFAELVAAFGLLWLLWRAPSLLDRARALLPLAPALALYVIWTSVVVRGASMSKRPTTYPTIAEELPRFFEFIGPTVPGAVAGVLLLGLLVLLASAARPARHRPPPVALRARNPASWLGAFAALCFVVLPASTAGVEGINNRFPWWAAIFVVFAWSPPRDRVPRAAALGALVAFGAGVMLHLGGLFARFDRESAGASRLIDRLGPGETLLAPVGTGSTRSFPGKPLIEVEQYATVRHGGLPNSSFAGYDLNYVVYANGKNPMPGIPTAGTSWLHHRELTRFDHVLVRGPAPTSASGRRLVVEAVDGEWTLAGVCGSRARPHCD